MKFPFINRKPKPPYQWKLACHACSIAFPRYVRYVSGHANPEDRIYSWRSFGDYTNDDQNFLTRHKCGEKDWDVAWEDIEHKPIYLGEHISAAMSPQDQAVFTEEKK